MVEAVNREAVRDEIFNEAQAHIANMANLQKTFEDEKREMVVHFEVNEASGPMTVWKGRADDITVDHFRWFYDNVHTEIAKVYE